MKKLNLKKEILAELSAAELVSVAGAAAEASAGVTGGCPTYGCALPTSRCPIVISGHCFENFTNGCTGC